MFGNLVYVPHGKYQVNNLGSAFVVYKKYELINFVGQGFYTNIIAKNKENGSQVIIQYTQNAYFDFNEAKQMIKEIKLLKHFNHDNIISLVDIIKPNNPIGDEDVYLVFDYMETNLFRVITSLQILSDQEIQYLAYQMLCALFYIHSANVIHCDIKPTNILINSNYSLKICGFKRAYNGFNEDQGQTEQIIFNSYTSPELIFNYSQKNKASDIWSVGCIIAELQGRKPLYCGKDYIEIIVNIIKILGNPTQEDMQFIDDKNQINFIQNQPKNIKLKWENLYPDSNPQLLDLLDKMLMFNPDKRYTAQQCLKHPYFKNLYSLEDEQSENPLDFSFNGIQIIKEELQKMIYKESLYFNAD